MHLITPEELERLCQKYRLTPDKEFGQNYLVDPRPIEAMVDAADLKKTDTVVEVGPGFGILTDELAEKAGRVVAFEIEQKLAPYWKDRLSELAEVEIVWGNVLREFAAKSSTIGVSYKVVANLPYQITSTVIRMFLEAVQPPEQMVIMVQKEVAERICAAPGDMSLLSVAVQHYAVPTYLMTVPRIWFWPAPQVDSAIISIAYQKQSHKDAEFTDQLFRLVKAGFANRRKLLIKNLASMLGKEARPQLQEIFHTIGITENARAQELTMEQWYQLVTLGKKII